MSVTPVSLHLHGHFARELGDLAVPWQAETTPDPRLLAVNDRLAGDLGLDPAWLRTPEGIGLLTGTRLPDTATPVAQAYAGHQFGGFSPRLGDGRALLVASSSTETAPSVTCTSRDPVARRSRAAATASPPSVRCCASTS